MARLLEKYKAEIIPAMMKDFNYKNQLRVPRITKIVVSMGVGKALEDGTRLESAMRDLAIITGQKAKYTKAKKSVAGFKLRSGNRVGCVATLRRERMYEFLDRLINASLPRVRDFRGVSPKGFDGRGNFTMGIKEEIIFPEISYDKIDKIKGLNITIVTTAKTDEEGRALLTHMGMPFAR